MKDTNVDISNVSVVILAAGKGTRMKGEPDRNKVTYHLHGKPIILHAREMLQNAGIESVIVVVGHAWESVKAVLGDTVVYAHQNEPKGTGDALKCALAVLPDKSDTVISMYGDDSAFYTPELIHELIATHTDSQAVITLLTVHKNNPTGLGRIIRDDAGEFIAIVEEKNANEEQKLITEINTGLFCFERDFLEEMIGEIVPNEVTHEYYITDLVDLAIKRGRKVNSINKEHENIWFGINTMDQLNEAETLHKVE